jgi:hypothetical protein
VRLRGGGRREGRRVEVVVAADADAVAGPGARGGGRRGRVRVVRGRRRHGRRRRRRRGRWARPAEGGARGEWRRRAVVVEGSPRRKCCYSRGRIGIWESQVARRHQAAEEDWRRMGDCGEEGGGTGFSIRRAVLGT